MVTYIVLVNVLSGKPGNKISIENQANLATSGVKSWSWHAGAAFKVLSKDIVSFPRPNRAFDLRDFRLRRHGDSSKR